MSVFKRFLVFSMAATNFDKLPLVRDISGVRQNIREFNRDLEFHRKRAELICSRQYYWVYDPSLNLFGPCTFVGIKNMTYALYDAVRATGKNNALDRANQSGQINALIGRFEKSDELNSKLSAWMIDTFGHDRMRGWQPYKWSFVSISGGDNPDDLANEVAGSKEMEKLLREQGYRLKKAQIDAIDDRAMQVAWELFDEWGFDLKNHSKKHSYDWYCKRGDLELYVEVKGTTGDGDEFFLTGKEEELSRLNPENMALVVVRNIVVSDGENPTATGGEWDVWYPWDVKDCVLTRLQSRCRLPEKVSHGEKTLAR